MSPNSFIVPELRSNPDAQADFLRKNLANPLHQSTCMEIFALMRTSKPLTKRVYKSVPGVAGASLSCASDTIGVDGKGHGKIVVECFDGETSTGIYSLLLAPGKKAEIKMGLWTVSFDGKEEYVR